MLKATCFCILISSVTFATLAQSKLRGILLDDATDMPLPSATLFLANTSIGTTTGPDGRFQLAVPPGQYNVVIQYVGYEPLIIQIDASQMADEYTFRLKQEVRVLPSVAIVGKRDKSWHQNLALFKKYFLGESINGIACTIANENDLIIDYNSEELSVFANVPIKIINKNLGYEIDYTMVKFLYAPREGRVFFAGYPYFKSIANGKEVSRSILNNRKRAYRGSHAHLAKSLLQADLETEKFEVRKLYRKPNPNRPEENTIRSAAQSYIKTEDQHIRDSLMENYISKRSMPAFVDVLESKVLTAEEIVNKGRDGKTYLTDQNLWHVTFTGEKEESNYRTIMEKSKNEQITVIHLLKSQELIDPSGHFTDPENLLLEGYMGWEKVGDMLPLEYSLPKVQKKQRP